MVVLPLVNNEVCEGVENGLDSTEMNCTGAAKHAGQSNTVGPQFRSMNYI